MNERVAILREQSLNTHPKLSAERARLITQFYAGAGLNSAPHAKGPGL